MSIEDRVGVPQGQQVVTRQAELAAFFSDHSAKIGKGGIHRRDSVSFRKHQSIRTWVPRFRRHPTHGMVGEHGCDMRNTHGRRGVSTAGSGAHFHGIAAKLNGFVVNRGFDGHAVLQGWGDEDEVSPLACIPATDGGPVEGSDFGRCGGIGSVEGDWHHHVDELAICFQDPRLLGSLQAQGDFG